MNDIGGIRTESGVLLTTLALATHGESAKNVAYYVRPANDPVPSVEPTRALALALSLLAG